MAEADPDLAEVSLTPLIMDPLNPNEDNGTFAPDDVEWADSFFVKFSEASDSDWSSFKEVRTEILNSSPEPPSSFLPENQMDDHLRLTDSLSFPSTEKVKSVLFSMDSDEDRDFIEEDDEEGTQGEGSDDVDDIIRRIQGEKLKGESGLENVSFPTHNEFAESENTFSGFDLSSPLYEDEEPSINEIFKVWDLSFSKEVDEFVEQMSEELIGDSPWAMLSTSVKSEVWPNLVNEPVDELAAGFCDLSLSQK